MAAVGRFAYLLEVFKPVAVRDSETKGGQEETSVKKTIPIATRITDRIFLVGKSGVCAVSVSTMWKI